MKKLQREDQEELTNLELLSLVELECKKIEIDQSAHKFRVQSYLIDTISKVDTQVSVATLRTQQIRDKRKLVKKSKY